MGHHPVVQTHRRSLINPAERLQLIAARPLARQLSQCRTGEDIARWFSVRTCAGKAAVKHASSAVIDRSASCAQRVRERGELAKTKAGIAHRSFRIGVSSRP